MAPMRNSSSVSSMVCDPGQADVLVSFELVEAVRNLPLLSPTGHGIVNDVSIKPMTVLSGAARMPGADELHGELDRCGGRVAVVDADAIAREAGNGRCANVALLAAAAPHLPIGERAWKTAIESRVPPKTLDANLRAFDLSFARVGGAE